MKKLYYVYADWRKKDVKFLKTLNLNRKPEEGYFGFSIREGVTYDKVTSHFSRKGSLFSKTKPSEYTNKFIVVTFSKKELNNAKYYALLPLGGETPDSRYPQPWKNEGYHTQVFSSNLFKLEKAHAMANKNQIAPFHIKKPK